MEPSIVIKKEGEWIDTTPVRLKKYAKYDQRGCETFNDALDDYYTEIIVGEEVIETAKESERDLARHQRILQRQRKALEDLKDQIERNKDIGNLIYLNLGNLQFLLHEIIDFAPIRKLNKSALGT